MMKDVVSAYAEVLRLIRRLPPASRSYYAQFARENFVAYSEVTEPAALQGLLRRTYDHTCWILNKYGVDKDAAKRLSHICHQN